MPLSEESKEAMAKAAMVAGMTVVTGPLGGGLTALALKVIDAEERAEKRRARESQK